MVYAVLGPAGTFTEEAAYSYWQKIDKPLEIAGSIGELFQLLNTGAISDALIPLENSQAGTIETTMMNLSKSQLSIKGEIYMPIRQALLGKDLYKLEDIELIISQPVAYAQCDEYINKYMPQVRREICASTTKAVQIVKAEKKKAVAIANDKAAHLYGMQIIAKDIHNSHNITRFVHISNQIAEIEVADKASMFFTLDDYPGSLLEALQIFASYDLNLSKIESRPGPYRGRNYFFYVDIDVKGKENKIESLINDLRKICLNINYLGAYLTKVS